MQKLVLHGILILSCVSIGQEAHAMKWTKYQWANGFRLGMKALNYASVGLYFIGSLKEREEGREKSIKEIKEHIELRNRLGQIFGDYAPHNLSQKSQNEILTFLYNAYPELKNTKIQIIENTQFFGNNHHNDVTYLSVPFNEHEFQKALLCKEKKVEGYVRKLINKERWKERLTLPEYIAKNELDGKAMMPTTIDLWQEILLHEGSHILHKDYNTGDNPLPFILVIIGTEKLKRLLGLNNIKLTKNLIANNVFKGAGSFLSIPIKIGVSCLCFLPINHWNEYRADQDAIERTSNPDLLKAASKSLNTVPQQVPSTIQEKIEYYLNPHPNPKTRAAYFAKAAQKLENEQELTRQALAYYMSGDDVPKKD